jgi:hypothetical protein
MDKRHTGNGGLQIKDKDAQNTNNMTVPGTDERIIGAVRMTSGDRDDIAVQPDPFTEHGFRRPVIKRCRYGKDPGIIQTSGAR